MVFCLFFAGLVNRSSVLLNNQLARVRKRRMIGQHCRLLHVVGHVTTV
ncbi:hypothetical protein KCP70_11490 [Salmonella enterica subsp. enterica]|nr:hypothetical protein KCP70_11490 [Salmonella enterica subsp. enterica]